MLRTFRFQLRPTRHQARTLTEWLAVSCEPYNAALEVRREAWKVARQRITYEDQTAELTAPSKRSFGGAKLEVDPGIRAFVPVSATTRWPFLLSPLRVTRFVSPSSAA